MKYFFILILANLDEITVEKLPLSIDQGVYYGWAQFKNQNEIYKMVTSIGTNPFYNGEKKTIVCSKKKERIFFIFCLII